MFYDDESHWYEKGKIKKNYPVLLMLCSSLNLEEISFCFFVHSESRSFRHRDRVKPGSTGLQMEKISLLDLSRVVDHILIVCESL